MEKLEKKLAQINWDFSDYNSAKYPIDINSIPWYPATLPAPIPKFLVALLSKENDVVLDPFGGKGTVIIEALKQNRRFSYNDLNPFASEITAHLVDIINSCFLHIDVLPSIYEEEKKLLSSQPVRTLFTNSYSLKQTNDLLDPHLSFVKHMLHEVGLSDELMYWYHMDTLRELVSIYRLIWNDSTSLMKSIRKLAFVSILKEVSSQRGHFSYVTDNCRPDHLVYHNATSTYLNMVDRIIGAIVDINKQYSISHSASSLLATIKASTVHCGDSRVLSHIDDKSIDLVITSPPYLCAQDYIKTMRLTNFFFPAPDFETLSKAEIGSRNQRRGKQKNVIEKFYNDMDSVLAELQRVMKTNAYFCLIMGQGKGKITQGFDTVADVANMATEKYGFELVFSTRRKISYKAVRIGGVESEEILIFQKKE